MNILIVTQYFWPEDFRINDLALGLHEKGHKITVLTGIPNYPSGKFFSGYSFLKPFQQEYKGIRVLRVPLVPRGNGKGWRLGLNYISFAFNAIVLIPFYLFKKYDLIFVCQYSPVTVGIPAIVLKKLRGTPIMFWIQDLWPESLSATEAVKSLWILDMVRKMVRFIYRNCDVILLQSKGFFDYLKDEGVNYCKLKYFPNWAEDLYRPVPKSKSLPEIKGLPEGFRIMFAGNIGAAQDFGTILNAAEKLRDYQDIHWLILGDGRMREWVEKEVIRRELEGNFHLLGRHPVESMPGYFSCSDVLLVTLKSELIFSLTIPSKVQSYLACGRPIIAALEGEGARVVEKSKSGLVCSPEDGNALAKAVLEMYNTSSSERQTMGFNGRAFYESNFERKMLLGLLETWMLELIKGRNAVAMN